MPAPVGLVTETPAPGNSVSLDCGFASPLPKGGILALDTSATPRPNAMAERLVIEATGRFLAPEARYQRVVAELAGIQAMAPDLVMRYSPCSMDSIVVRFDEQGIEHVRTGAYTAWDSFNDTLRSTGQKQFAEGIQPLVEVEFAGRYDMRRVALEYEELPNIESASPNSIGGDGDDVCLSLRDDSRHLFIFDRGSGDCPAGCTRHVYRGFETDEDGNITELGTWDNAAGNSPPEWYADSDQCQAFLDHR